MTAAAAGVEFPKWMLLEPYVFRRDDDKSFPDDTVAPIRASGTTSWGAEFHIAFFLVDPPPISRLYAQLPGFPGPGEEDPLGMVATHRHLALFVVATTPHSAEGLLQNLFIFKADKNNPSLKALPPCTERWDAFCDDHRPATPRPVVSLSSGLWCDGGDNFVVAELTLYVPTEGLIRTKAFADICLLRSSFSDDQQDHKWDTVRLPILSTTDQDLWKLSHWQMDAVIPFQRWLCWIDYQQGILFGNVYSKKKVTLSFLWFPPDKYSLGNARKAPCSGNGQVSVIDHGRLLKFVYVARHDGGPFYGALKPGTGFTITCYTLLVSGSSMAWKEEYTVTSNELPDCFQRGGLPMFPQVDIDKPQLVHLLFVEFGKAYGKMSVLTIDMNKKTVESCYLYVDGNEPSPTEDQHYMVYKSFSPTPSRFLPCEFPSFWYLSRKRKDYPLRSRLKEGFCPARQQN